MSIRTRLAFGLLVPIGLAVAALGVALAPVVTGSPNVQASALMSGMLMFVAIGTGLVMLEINTRALLRPIEEACAATNALLQGHHQRRIRIERLDETGELLVALDELGNYLTVMLPDDDEPLPGRPVLVPAAPATLERIVEQLREGEDDDTYDTRHAASPQPTSLKTPQRPRLVSSNPG